MGALRNILLLIIPFLLIIIINEVSRPNIQGKPYKRFATAMNSRIRSKEKCTWECHENTTYCKQNHVKLLSNYFSYTDTIYNRTIRILKGENQAFSFYQMTNVVFLVFFIPLLIWCFLAKSLTMQDQIHKLKKS
jgi:hypothetical protein